MRQNTELAKAANARSLVAHTGTLNTLLMQDAEVGPLIECCAAELGQTIEGFGSVAFLARDEDAGSHTFLTLVRNDFVLELIAAATGETSISEKAIRQLASALLGRLRQR